MKFNQTVLENGLKIITVPMVDNPAVTFLVMVSTGSKYEAKETNGLSHFLEHMVFKGTPKRPTAMDISRELESLGAHYNAFTAQEYTGYYAKVNSTDADKAIEIVSDIYLNPLLDSKEMEKEKGVIIEEIRMYKDIPQRQIHNLFMNLVYGNQPAGWSIAGPEENIKSFTVEHFKKYRSEHYVAEATTVVIAGSINEKDILEKVKIAFSEIPKTKKDDKVLVKEDQKKPEILVEFKESDQAHMIMGFRSFSIKSEYDTTLNVLATLLGKGMSSRLFQKIREEMGAGYYIYAGNDAYTDHGIFTISAGVDIKRVGEIITTLLSEVKKIINDPITEEELKKVKDYMCGSFMLGLETSDSRAEFVAGNSILKGRVETPEEEISKIRAVTVEQLKDIARKIFVDEGLNLAIIGPFKDKTEFEKLLTFK